MTFLCSPTSNDSTAFSNFNPRVDNTDYAANCIEVHRFLHRRAIASCLSWSLQPTVSGRRCRSSKLGNSGLKGTFDKVGYNASSCYEHWKRIIGIVLEVDTDILAQ